MPQKRAAYAAEAGCLMPQKRAAYAAETGCLCRRNGLPDAAPTEIKQIFNFWRLKFFMNVNNELTKQIDSWFQRNDLKFRSDLEKLIAINSVRGPEEEGMPYGRASFEALETAKKMLNENGVEAENFENIVITADFVDAPPVIGVLAHLDIVAAGEGWDYDPFELTIDEGRYYGRGVIDNKGPAVAAMYAMYCARELCPDLKHGYRLILGSGEETGCLDIKEYLKKNDPPPNVFSPDSDFPIVNVEKGRLLLMFKASWSEDTASPRILEIHGGETPNVVPNVCEAVIEGISLSDVEAFCKKYSAETGAEISAREVGDTVIITSKGKASHACYPESGLNAQTALVKMLSAMPFAESKGFEYIRALNDLMPHGDYIGQALGLKMSDEISGNLTLNFGVLNYSATEMSGNFDSRTPLCADDIDIFGNTKAKFEAKGFEVTSGELVKCHVTDENTPFVQTLARVYEKYTGNKGECMAIGGSTYVHGIPGGVVFGCRMPGENNNLHGPNENISIEHLMMSAKMFTEVIIEMCG